MIFNIIEYFEMNIDKKLFLLKKHLMYKKLLIYKKNVQNNPYDTNYKIIQDMNNLNMKLYKFENVFIKEINTILDKKLYYHNDDIYINIFNNIFYNDITEIILNYISIGKKMIFIKLYDKDSMIIISNISHLKNIIKYEFITKIYVEEYNHNGMTMSDFNKLTPIYDFENLTMIPFNYNDISIKSSLYEIISISINIINLKNKKTKTKTFFINKIEQLDLIEKYIKKKNKFVLSNFNLSKINTIKRNYIHKTILPLVKIQNDIFTNEIYDFLINMLFKNNT